jgi:hypothetical protein
VILERILTWFLVGQFFWWLLRGGRELYLSRFSFLITLLYVPRLANLPPVSLTPVANLPRVSQHQRYWCQNLLPVSSYEYLRKFLKKIKMILMLFSRAWGKMIHEKNLKQKISWNYPFRKIGEKLRRVTFYPLLNVSYIFFENYFPQFLNQRKILRVY